VGAVLRSARAVESGTLVIGAVLLRYNGEAASLQSAVESIVDSIVESGRTDLVDIVIVDNASTVDVDAADRVAASFQHSNQFGNRLVRVIRRTTNGGFAVGVNVGIGALHKTCEFVLLLNDDARLEPGALRLLSSALQAATPDVISVAPKIYLDGEDGLLESVGMAVNRSGEAKNVGLGQLDLGQFDDPQETFGPTFGAALIRRNAFSESGVGQLREDYFLYYEDVEWNWRAQRMGFRSLTVPSAVAWHQMSASSRSGDVEGAYSMKHRCIERNLLATGAELLPAGDAIRLWAYRWPRLVKGLATGRFPKASFMAAVDAAARLPKTLSRRRSISRSYATAPVGAALRFWPPEPIFFDPVTYTPERSWKALGTAASLARQPALRAACEARDVGAAISAVETMTDPAHAQRVTQFLSRLTGKSQPSA
jgi:GT2 family glycosyltransferase